MITHQMKRLKFGMWLKNQRQGRNLTQRDLALRAGISAGMVARLEAGDVGYSLRMVDDLADALIGDEVTEVERERMRDVARAASAGFDLLDLERIPDDERLAEFLHAYEGDDPRLIAAKGAMTSIEGYLKAREISEEVLKSKPLYDSKESET